MNLRHSPLAAAILAVLTTPVLAETPDSEAAPALPTVTVTGTGCRPTCVTHCNPSP